MSPREVKRLTNMQNFKEAYCLKFSCPADNFERRVMAAAFYPHARFLLWFGGHRAEHFTIDRGLIGYCGTLRTIPEISAELREYAAMPANREFLRGVLRLRLSGRRVRHLARVCLASCEAPARIPELGKDWIRTSAENPAIHLRGPG